MSTVWRRPPCKAVIAEAERQMGTVPTKLERAAASILQKYLTNRYPHRDGMSVQAWMVAEIIRLEGRVKRANRKPNPLH